MCNLGMLLERQGKLRKATALFEEALMGRSRVHGRSHIATQALRAALLRVIDAQGKMRDAREVQAQYGDCK
jgi:hypothetical protein